MVSLTRMKKRVCTYQETKDLLARPDHVEDGTTVLRVGCWSPHILIGGASSALESSSPMRTEVVFCAAVRCYRAAAAVNAKRCLHKATTPSHTLILIFVS